MAYHCSVCGQAIPIDGDPEYIWSDGNWTIRTRSDLPGWVNLQANRHVEGFWSLDEDQQLSLGRALKIAGAVAKAASQAERVYIYWMGEDNIHFQFHIAPRISEEEPAGVALHMMMYPIARFEKWRGFFDPERTAVLGRQMREFAARMSS